MAIDLPPPPPAVVEDVAAIPQAPQIVLPFGMRFRESLEVLEARSQNVGGTQRQPTRARSNATGTTKTISLFPADTDPADSDG